MNEIGFEVDVKKDPNLEWYRWLQCVQEVIRDFKIKRNCEIIFYRGQGDASAKPIPMLGREGYKIDDSRESTLFHEFKAWSSLQIEKEHSDWELLFLMRHYGIPTRLLDWTESFSIALFFALKNADDTDAVVLLLDPYELNRRTIGEPSIQTIGELPEWKNIDLWIGKKKQAFSQISGDAFSLYPPKSNPRLLAQKGLFTYGRVKFQGVKVTGA
jgi:hypothetical protein